MTLSERQTVAAGAAKRTPNNRTGDRERLRAMARGRHDVAASCFQGGDAPEGERG